MSLEQGLSSLFGIETHHLENLSITNVIQATGYLREGMPKTLYFYCHK